MSLKKLFRKKKDRPAGPIEIKIGDHVLMANGEHPLGSYLAHYKYYSRNLPRIAKLLEAKYPVYNIVDVGANIGDTIALIRSVGVDQFIYAIEGDPLYFEFLRKNIGQFKNAELFKTFLGEENGSANFSLQTTHGTANLVQGESNIIPIEKFDDLAIKHKIKDVKLFKIDTDGFDLKIIRGAWQFIKEDKPVLFFEYDANYLEKLSENGPAMLADLYNIGYRTAMYYDNFGKFLLAVNLGNKDIAEHLYAYMRKNEGAFNYYDICLFHQDDDDLARDVIKAEMQFFK